MRLILIRHAAATGQEATADLSKTGTEQAEALSEYLLKHPIDALYSSPYQRAIQTIHPFALKTGQKIRVLDSLRERILSGKPQTDWLKHVECSFQSPDYCLPGGESHRTTNRRALAAVDIILQSKATNPLAVSHGNLIAAFLSHIDPAFGFNDWQAMKNPDGFEIIFDKNEPSNFRPLNLT